MLMIRSSAVISLFSGSVAGPVWQENAKEKLSRANINLFPISNLLLQQFN
jgi:hypothetical protein